jgi:hypothetical protein
METTHFLVTGMFRSGTTLVARVLNANRNIICASDPFAPIFKAYRNSFGRSIQPDFDIDAPLHDYYFDVFQNGLFHAMQTANFDVSVDAATIDSLIYKVKQHSEAYSPLIHNHLHLLKGKNFSEVFRSGLRVIEKAYPKERHKALGFKEVWVGEFAPHFLKIAEGAKVIHVVRDPRAVVSSNFVSGARYPLLFLARQWRKLATLAWSSAAKSDNVKIIKFEDLIYSPQKTAMEICGFLGVDFDEQMTSVGELKDGANEPWYQNSSYKDIDSEVQSSSPAELNLKAVERWRSALPTEFVRLVEKLCYFEMLLFGYDFDSNFLEKHTLDEGLLFQDDQQFLSDWIKPYSSYDYCKEMMAENVRHDLMRSGVRLDEGIEKLFALDRDAYAKLISLG